MRNKKAPRTKKPSPEFYANMRRALLAKEGERLSDLTQKLALAEAEIEKQKNIARAVHLAARDQQEAMARRYDRLAHAARVVVAMPAGDLRMTGGEHLQRVGFALTMLQKVLRTQMAPPAQNSRAPNPRPAFCSCVDCRLEATHAAADAPNFKDAGVL